MPGKSKGKAKKSKRSTGPPPGCVRTDQVHISETPKLSVTPDCVLVSKENAEHVTWIHKEGKPFVVFFKKKSPFDDAIFYPGKEDSGFAKSHAEYKGYEYTVKAGHTTLDPQVIIVR